ncbi:hypothetical protein INR49_022645 [Caranx melampygus]|nr:hypothetical protein INR49_022645 [Caranx melampygus]
MGCGTSVATETQGKKRVEPAAMKAAVLIQRWYRRYVARLEMRRRYTWNIFQSIEYAGEQDQLQLSSFFSFMLDNLTQLSGNGPELISQLLDPVVDPWLDRETCYDLIPVPESYTDLGCRSLSPSPTPTPCSTLHARYVLQLLYETKKLLKQMPNIIHLSTSCTKEITICGDLHGRLDDLLLIFYKNGLPSAETPYVFNGDFVDRGKKSIEVVVLLFAYLLLYPDYMHLNRGNHEDHIMNLSLLPVATVIDGKILIVHGGISDQTDLDLLSSIERHKFGAAGPGPVLQTGQEVEVHGRFSSQQQPQPQQEPKNPQPEKEEVWLQPTGQRHLQFLLVLVLVLSSSLCSPRTPSCLSPRSYPSSPSMPYNINVLQVPFLDSLSSVPPPLPPQHEREWKQWTYCGVTLKPRRLQPQHIQRRRLLLRPRRHQELLLQHGLQLLIRSHECKQEGYELCHGGQVITIFSASNYYERAVTEEHTSKWAENWFHVSTSIKSAAAHASSPSHRVRAAEGSALRALKEKLFSHRTELMAGFQQHDQNKTGTVSVSEWAQVLESVLRLDLPWRTLRPHLTCLAPDGSVDYQSCFEDMEVEIPLPQVTPNLADTLFRYRTDIEIIFNIIDKDHSGLISTEEFRHTWRLFSAHLGVAIDDRAIDDLARSIDFNKDGSIDFTEFLEAFRVVHKLDNKDQTLNGKTDGEKY